MTTAATTFAGLAKGDKFAFDGGTFPLDPTVYVKTGPFTFTATGTGVLHLDLPKTTKVVPADKLWN